MRKAFMVAVCTLLLAACSESNIEKAQEAAALVKKNCGLIVSIADIAAAFSAPNPAITGVAAMAKAICSQAQAEKENSNIIFQHYARSVPVHYEGISAQEWLARIDLAQVEQPEPAPLPEPDPPEAPPETVTPKPQPLPPPEECVATVNGVCIREEEKQ